MSMPSRPVMEQLELSLLLGLSIIYNRIVIVNNHSKINIFLDFFTRLRKEDLAIVILPNFRNSFFKKRLRVFIKHILTRLRSFMMIDRAILSGWVLSSDRSC